jgi:hypothetical protein
MRSDKLSHDYDIFWYEIIIICRSVISGNPLFVACSIIFDRCVIVIVIRRTCAVAGNVDICAIIKGKDCGLIIPIAGPVISPDPLCLAIGVIFNRCIIVTCSLVKTLACYIYISIIIRCDSICYILTIIWTIVSLARKTRSLTGIARSV